MLAMEKLSLPVESGKSTPLFFFSRPNYRRYLILFPDENKQETVPLCMSGSLRTNRNRFYTPPGSAYVYVLDYMCALHKSWSRQ